MTICVCATSHGVSSRDVRIVCPRLKIESHVRDVGMNASSGEAPEDTGDSDTQKMMCCAAVGRKSEVAIVFRLSRRSAVSGQRVRIAALLYCTIFLAV